MDNRLDIKKKEIQLLILKEMLKLYDDPNYREKGLCYALQIVYMNTTWVPYNKIAHLDELYALRPPLSERYESSGERSKYGAYWFLLGDKESRKELLRQAIKNSE